VKAPPTETSRLTSHAETTRPAASFNDGSSAPRAGKPVNVARQASSARQCAFKRSRALRVIRNSPVSFGHDELVLRGEPQAVSFLAMDDRYLARRDEWLAAVYPVVAQWNLSPSAATTQIASCISRLVFVAHSIAAPSRSSIHRV